MGLKKSIIQDTVVFKHELIVVVHQKLNLLTLALFLPISYSEKRSKQPALPS